jgi:hypothetical protein
MWTIKRLRSPWINHFLLLHLKTYKIYNYPYIIDTYMYKENIIEITTHGCVNMTFKNLICVKRKMKLVLRHKSSWQTNKLKFGMRLYIFKLNNVYWNKIKMKWNKYNKYMRPYWFWLRLWFILVFSKIWLWELLRLSFVDNILLL